MAGLREHHRRIKTHHSFAVRFAYLNFQINGCLTLVWGGPVMALTFLDRHLAHSVSWVAFLSVWALCATHAGGCIAAYAAVHAAEDNTRSQTRATEESHGHATRPPGL